MESKPSNILIILNSISRRKNFFYKQLYPGLSRNFPIEVWETAHAGHAEELAIKGATSGFQIILAAGGDGTMHQVLNGVLMADKSPIPTLGLVPLGSGNDLARTFGLKADVRQLLKLLDENHPRQMDIGLALSSYRKTTARKRFFINECSLGMGPEVVRRIDHGGRLWGPGVMYLKAIVTTFFSLMPEVIRIKTEAYEWTGKARVFVVANGKSFGHSIYIAPDASLDDGLLNTFLAGNMPLWRFLLLLQRLKSAKKVNDVFIEYGFVKSVNVESEKPLPVEADGELIGHTPLHCEILPHKINFLY